MKVLSKSFYQRDTKIVARDLLGKILVHGDKQGRITEVEAYLGAKDPASRKNIPGSAGTAYVYLIYGLHWCLNIITGPAGHRGCVLIQGAGDIFGPGRVAKLFDITGEHNGADLTKGPIIITQGVKNFNIGVSPRIGITKAMDLPLRFYVIDRNSQP